MKFQRSTGMTLSALLGMAIAVVSQASANIIVGGSMLNGDFNSDTSTVDQRTFAETPNWVNIGTGDQTVQATRTNLDFDGTRNAVLSHAASRVFGLDTGYDLMAGDVFDVSYVWRDASGWDDSADQVVVSLFITDDGTITGNPFVLAGLFSGLSTADSAYELVNHDNAYTAMAANAGQRLFVGIDTFHPTDDAGFARLDNFALEVTPVPEPSALLLACIAGIGAVILRSRWK